MSTDLEQKASPRLESPDVQQAGDGGDSRFVAVLFCFLLSGFAALVYQTAWMRQFSVVFGTSELAVATVLAAYMAGLALGASIAGKHLHRIKRPVLWYGALELGIALGALLVAPLLSLVRVLQAALIGGQGELMNSGGGAQLLFYLLATFAVVLIPTTLMGATLPLLTRHAVRRRDHIGPRVGLLYATNTAGAVVGTLTAAFLFLPSLGLRGTVFVGVGANALVFLVAALLARKVPPPVPEPSTAMDERQSAAEPIPDARARWILPLILVSGAVSFAYEVLWTRLLGQVLGSSVTAFATMLASFLTGITLGGALASLVARSRKVSAAGFVLAQLGIAGLSVLVYRRMDELPALVAEGKSDLQLAFQVMLPATICIGATFPFALRVLARSRTEAGSASARVYAWNTVGAIAGALLCGFVLIPSLGFAGTARLAMGTSLVLAAAAGMLILWPQWRVVGAASVICLGFLTRFHPEAPARLMSYTPFDPQGLYPGEVMSTTVGRSATVVLLDLDDIYEVRSSGLPEAGITPAGVPPFGRNSERFLTALPVAARPAARSMLVVGFGGGVALEAVPPTIEDLDVVELEPEIITANRLLSGLRDRDPFDDPRLKIYLNDVRGALSLTTRRWDIIVSQPSHPWTAGASHLYTREFADLCREHLTEAGVFVQWINSEFLDATLFRSLGATLLASFPHVRLYRPTQNMLFFLGSEAELAVEQDARRSGAPYSQHPEFWAEIGVSDYRDLLAILALDQAGLEALCRDAPLSTDDRNLLAMRSGMEIDDNLQAGAMWDLLAPEDPLLRQGSSLLGDLGLEDDVSYLARRISFLLPGRYASLPGPWKSLPEGDQGLYYQLAPQLRAAARGGAGAQAVRAAADRLSGAAATVWSAWKLRANERWSELEAMDDALADVRPWKPWYLHAAQLRAAWRVGQASPEKGHEELREAVRILDRALVLEPQHGLLLGRLQAARLLDWPEGQQRTLELLLYWLGPMREALAPAALAHVQRQLRPWLGYLEHLASDDRLRGDRVRLLRERLATLLTEEEEQAPPAPNTEQVFR